MTEMLGPRQSVYAVSRSTRSSGTATHGRCARPKASPVDDRRFVSTLTHFNATRQLMICSSMPLYCTILRVSTSHKPHRAARNKTIVLLLFLASFQNRSLPKRYVIKTGQDIPVFPSRMEPQDRAMLHVSCLPDHKKQARCL